MRLCIAITTAVAIGPALYGTAIPITLNGSNGAAVDQLVYNATDPNCTGSCTPGTSPSLDGEFMINDNAAASGYLNVVDASGNWIVQNLPMGVAGLAGGLSGLITERINLPTGTVSGSSDNLMAEVDSAPLVNFSSSIATGDGDSTSPTTVADETLAIGGGADATDDNEDGISTSPAGTVSFNSGGSTSLTYQSGHPNVSAAVNQCAPAAVANSLTYLGVNPLPNNPGSFGSANSLVAALDTAMGRASTGCGKNNTGPCGVWPLQGKLQYLGANGLGSLSVNYQNAATGQAGLAGNITVNGVTAVNQGAPTFAFIQQELAAGEDVELDIQWNGGKNRHYVDVTGAGTILGVQWITTVSDQKQGQAGGTSSTQFDWVSGTNGLPLWGAGAIIDQVITESLTPEPGTLWLIGLGVLAVALARRRRPG